MSDQPNAPGNAPVKDGEYVAVSVRASGIHPKTARMVALGVQVFTADGTVHKTWHSTFTIGEDPGPEHLHNLRPEDLHNSPRFASKLREVCNLIDGRTVVAHHSPMVWGFIVEEARRARVAANRKNRGRRDRGRSRKRGGRPPRPSAVVDTLATARIQGTVFSDRRLFAVARSYGVVAPDPVATVDNIEVLEKDRTIAELNAVRELFLAQRNDTTHPVLSWAPSELRADPVGLQRSAVRVDAMEAPRPVANPGRYQPGHALQTGMEFAIAPEISIPGDTLIAAGVAAGLAYSEKVTRETSVLVCNQPADIPPDAFTGKAMHAKRKEIPLVADEAFLRLAADLQD
ncbi:DNA polymerase III subunit epsilon [Corynebacterium sp. TAE3-ERU12]|uniref:DNA polymerase III subunit epsilon n=1 Tax=Corynebacterium sp. TAE3-ERU12 TaxID=2849491 RepID=UPI001C46FC02|nr:DNA polymerase III subunit epsilon [Corynebacterium sp. TAE3-ERU12]MBV7294448.1 DNA polymerase III subunit epsilon [Corynebacterium sp. TAE3-ERU12]